MTVPSGRVAPAAGAASEAQSRLLALYLHRTPLVARPRPAAPARSDAARVEPGSASRPAPNAPGPPTGVTRAVAFIERRAADRIGLTDIAAAAGLSPRALQAAFRRQLDTTPLAHLRSVRLARAHAELRSARPGDGRSVSTVANAWGFSQLSRFARDYRRRYGVSPHQTLGTGAP